MKPKKTLGQNWLTQPKAAEDIVAAGKVSQKDTVLEIGPGRGALTEKLLSTGAKVFAVEKDVDLLPELNKKFAPEIRTGRLKLIQGDIIKLLGDKSIDSEFSQILEKKYKLIANIPYYITGEIIRGFLELPRGHQPELAVLLVQKEVAERIVAGDGKESILSLSVKIFGEPKIVKRISRGNFFPVPNVDSAVLLIDNISHDKTQGLRTENFFELIKKGFGQKRKLLKSNLSLETETMKKCDVPEKSRAEDLILNQWICLTKIKNN